MKLPLYSCSWQFRIPTWYTSHRYSEKTKNKRNIISAWLGENFDCKIMLNYSKLAIRWEKRFFSRKTWHALLLVDELYEGREDLSDDRSIFALLITTAIKPSFNAITKIHSFSAYFLSFIISLLFLPFNTINIECTIQYCSKYM